MISRAAGATTDTLPMKPTHRRFAVRPLSLALHGALLLAPLAAIAAEDPAPQAATNAVQLDKLTVTAQKREQQVADVPIAISAYSGELLQKLGVVRMDDLSNYVPGFYTQLQSPNNPGYVVRGITSDDTSAFQTSRVSVFQDGVDISQAQGSNVALYDMQRVEVLRGPQGTLFGRGAEAGAVSLIQNKATSDFAAGFNLDAGNYSSVVASAYLNGALNEGVDGRIAVYDAKHDGYYDNRDGGDVYGEDTQAVRGALHFDIGETSKYDVIANWEHDTPSATDFNSNKRLDADGNWVPNDVYGSAALNGGKYLGVDRVVYGITGLGEFQLNDAWTLSSITGLRRWSSDERFDGDGTDLYLIQAQNDAKSKQASQELRFNYDSGGRVKAFTGVDFYYQQGVQQAPAATNEQQFAKYIMLPVLAGQLGIPVDVLSGLDLGHGAIGPTIDAGINPLTGQAFQPGVHDEGYVNYGMTRAWEAFGDMTVDVTDSLSLTAGARLSHETIYGAIKTIDSTVPGTFGTLLGGTGNNDLFPSTNGQRVGRQDEFNSAVGRLVLNYRFGSGSNFYASVSRGRKPDVISATEGSGAAVVSELPAEIVNSGEVGVKGDIGNGRFLYDIDAFYYRYENFQSYVTQGLQQVAVNAGRAHAPGAEISLQENFTPNLGVLLNYTYIKARFDNTDKDGNVQDYAGNMMRMTPDNSASIALLYNHPFGDGNSFYFRPSYRWKSKMYFDDSNPADQLQTSYGTLNARTGFTLDRGRWDVGLWGDNLTGKKYLIDAGNTGMDYGFPTFIPGAPRTYGVSLSGRF